MKGARAVAASDAAPVAIDVLVVGGGASGLAAAVAAAERGVRTVLIERRPVLGGTTALAIGSFCAAGTRLQRKAGIVDSVDLFIEDMAKIIPTLIDRDSTTLRALLAAESGPTVEWLEDMGISFAGPFAEPPHSTLRMHNAVPGSKVYVDRLAKRARSLGVEILLNAELTQLTVDERGDVTGAECAVPGGQVVFKTRRGVILAAGDMSGNAAMRKEWLTGPAVQALPVNRASTGDGQRAGEAIGASLANMDVVIGPQLRFQPPPGVALLDRLPSWAWLGRIAAWVFNKAPVWAIRPIVKHLMVTHMSPSLHLFEEGAVLVNTEGRRFADERSSVSTLAEQPGSAGYIVFDEAIAKRFGAAPHHLSTVPGLAYAYLGDYRRGRPDLVHEGRSVGALARNLGMDPSVLDESVKSATLDLKGKLVALGPVYSMLTITEGGLTIDERCRVLGTDGSTIRNLFAAGGNGGGLILQGHGLHLSWAITSGRIAGATAAQGVPQGIPAQGGGPHHQRMTGQYL